MKFTPTPEKPFSSPREMAVFNAIKQGKLDRGEIAFIYGMTPNYVGAIISRARKRGASISQESAKPSSRKAAIAPVAPLAKIPRIAERNERVLAVWNKGRTPQREIAQRFGLTTGCVSGILNQARLLGRDVLSKRPKDLDPKISGTAERNRKILDMWNRLGLPVLAIAESLDITTQCVEVVLSCARKEGILVRARQRKGISEAPLPPLSTDPQIAARNELILEEWNKGKKTYAEIADIFGVTENSVANAIYTARKKGRQVLALTRTRKPRQHHFGSFAPEQSGHPAPGE